MHKLGVLISATVLALLALLMQPAVARMEEPVSVQDTCVPNEHDLRWCLMGAMASKLNGEEDARYQRDRCLAAAGNNKQKQQICENNHAAALQRVAKDYDAYVGYCYSTYTFQCPAGERCNADQTKCEPIPEPATLLLTAGGFVVAGKYLRRRVAR